MLRHHASFPAWITLTMLLLFPEPVNRDAPRFLPREPDGLYAVAPADRLYVEINVQPLMQGNLNVPVEPVREREAYLRPAFHGASRQQSDVPVAAVLQDPMRELRQAAKQRLGIRPYKRQKSARNAFHGHRRVIYASSMRWVLA